MSTKQLDPFWVAKDAATLNFNHWYHDRVSNGLPVSYPFMLGKLAGIHYHFLDDNSGAEWRRGVLDAIESLKYMLKSRYFHGDAADTF